MLILDQLIRTLMLLVIELWQQRRARTRNDFPGDLQGVSTHKEEIISNEDVLDRKTFSLFVAAVFAYVYVEPGPPQDLKCKCIICHDNNISFTFSCLIVFWLY